MQVRHESDWAFFAQGPSRIPAKASRKLSRKQTMSRQRPPPRVLKRKMYPWRGRGANEEEDVPMKRKMCQWSGICGHDVPMKGKMCPWRGRCANEAKDVAMKMWQLSFQEVENKSVRESISRKQASRESARKHPSTKNGLRVSLRAGCPPVYRAVTTKKNTAQLKVSSNPSWNRGGPLTSKGHARKAQIASYLAHIRRFLAPTAWASSTSTTKKISPQATQAWFRKGSRRFWAGFLGNGWKRAVAVPDMLAAPSVETIQWHTHVLGVEGQSQPQAGIAEAHWQAKGMPGSSCHLPQIPLFLKVARQKNNIFWRNRAFFPVASGSNPRCSKAQIASYLAHVRRFLAPTAWASSASTTKKISPQATQAWFRKGSRRFRTCFFWAMVGKGSWLSHACGTIGWSNTMTYPWEESNLHISSCPWSWRSVPTPAGIAEAHWQAKGMPGSSCHLPQIPLFLKVARQKTT